MALDVEVGTFTKTTAGAPTTDVVSTGFTPKALILWGNLGDTSNAERDGDIQYCVGFSDGTNDLSVALYDEDEAAAEIASRRFQSAKCICFINATVVLAEGDVDFNSSDFTVNWSTNDSTASLIHYIVYGGADITGVQVGQFSKVTDAPPITQNVATDSDVRGITNGKGVLLTLNHRGTAQNAVVVNGNIGFSGATSDDGAKEGSVITMYDHATNRGEPRQAYSESKAIMLANPGTGAIMSEGDLDAWLDDGTNGFRIDWTTNEALAQRVAFLIIKGGQWELDNETASTTVTTKATTTAFQPKGLLMWGVRRTTEGTTREDSAFQVGASDGTTESSAQSAAINNAAETHVGTASSITKSNRILTPVDPGAPTVDGEADLDSFNDNDFTLDWTDAASSAWKFLWLVCGDDASVGGIKRHIAPMNVSLRI